MNYSKSVRWLTGAFGLMIVSVILLADLDRLPGFISRLYAFKYGDILGHFILFGILACLLTISFPRSTIHLAGMTIPIATGLLAIIIVLEEISQVFILTRSFSYLDLAASLTGWGLGWAVAIWLDRKKTESSE